MQIDVYPIIAEYTSGQPRDSQKRDIHNCLVVIKSDVLTALICYAD